jgi:RNA polymerase sigma factor (TIGR02999 family)
LDTSQVTILLNAFRQGDQSALERLTPLLYPELRRIAAARLRAERAGHTLQPTALVHEAYIRLAGHEQSFESRSHFLAIAATVMRQILVDSARKFRAAKRGGEKVPLDEASGLVRERPANLVDLDEALRALAATDARKSRIIEMRHFGGLTSEEVAAVLGISIPTVSRETRLAEAWLHSYLKKSATASSAGK